MSIKVTCECGHSWSVADSVAGQHVRCKECQEKLRVPKMAAARRMSADDHEADHRDDQADARADRLSRRRGFARTDRGLGIHYFGIAISLLAYVIAWLALLLLVGAGVVPLLARIAHFTVSGALIACVALMSLAGLTECASCVLCLSIPGSQARGVLLGTLGVRVLAVCGGIGLLIASLSQAAAAVAVLGMLGGWILWMFFLRQVAIACKDRRLGADVLRVLGKGLLTAVVVVITELVVIGFLKWFFGLETLQHRMTLLLAAVLLVGAVAGICYYVGTLANFNVGSFWVVLLYPTGIPFVLEYLDLIGTLRAVVSRRS